MKNLYNVEARFSKILTYHRQGLTYVMLHLESRGEIVVLPIHFTGLLRPFRKI
jgi:hypothetical protein